MIVQIKDYQSIKSAKINLVPGLTAIIGKTNAGKSAVVRAISDLLNNDISDSDVRIGGSGEGVVAIKCVDRGHTVVIRRNPTNNSFKTSYKVNGEVIEKVGKNRLDMEVEPLGLDPINGMDIHFIRQEDLPFLVFENPYKTYEFLSQSKSTVLIDTSSEFADELKSVNKELKENLVEADILKTRYNNIKAYLEKYPYIKNVIEAKNLCKSLLKEINAVKSIKEKISNLELKESEVDKEIEKLNNLVHVDLGKVRENYNYIVNTVSNVSSAKESLKTNELRLDKVLKEIEKLEEVNFVIDADLNSLASMSRELKSTKKLIDNLEIINSKDISIDKEIDKLSSINVFELDKYSDVVKELSDISYVGKKKSEYENYINNIKNIETKIGAVEVSIKETEEEIGKYPMCPTCNRPMSVCKD